MLKIRPVSVEPYPFGKKFAVSLIDDTDGATIENVSPVYDYLHKNNFFCTKTIWPLKPNSISGKYPEIPQNGDTLKKHDYKNFCRELQTGGFEIALHTASAGNSKREKTIAAYKIFEDTFGHPPDTNIMHSRNIENIYWGKHCTKNRLFSYLVSCLEPLDFCGHKKESEYYWGDICREKTKYVRLFETLNHNTLSFDPATPYHDPDKPDVNWWFSATYGEGSRFFKIINEKTIRELANERGASIIHLYLRQYFLGDRLSNKFIEVIEALASQPDGWYVPINKLLDRLISIRNLTITYNKNEIRIKNNSNSPITELSLNVPERIELWKDIEFKIKMNKNEFNQINLGILLPQESVNIFSDQKIIIENKSEVPPDYNRLLAGYAKRFLWQFMNGRPGLFYREDLPWAKEVI